MDNKDLPNDIDSISTDDAIEFAERWESEFISITYSAAMTISPLSPNERKLLFKWVRRRMVFLYGESIDIISYIFCTSDDDVKNREAMVNDVGSTLRLSKGRLASLSAWALCEAALAPSGV